MIIIWGSTSKTKNVEEGEFYCPQCQGAREYSFMRVHEYFTLYFIPLFSTRTLGEYVECRECGGQFVTEVLDISPRQLVSRTDSGPAPNGEELLEVLPCDEPIRLRAVDHQGNDTFADLEVYPRQLDFGETVRVELPDGRIIQLKLGPDMKGMRVRLQGQTAGGRGDLLLRVCERG